MGYRFGFIINGHEVVSRRTFDTREEAEAILTSLDPESITHPFTERAHESM